MGGGFGSFRVHTRFQDGCCRELQAPVGRQQAPTWSLGLLWDVNWSLMDHLRAGRQLGGPISSPVTRSERLMGPPSSPALGASRRSSPGCCMPPSPQRSESRVQIAQKGPCTMVSACCTAWWGRQPTVVPKQDGHQGSRPMQATVLPALSRVSPHHTCKHSQYPAAQTNRICPYTPLAGIRAMCTGVGVGTGAPKVRD